MVSIKDIASDLGVTAATVSNALNSKGRVSERLAERIKARANALGYRPSSAAVALKSGRSNILGLVMPDLTNPLFPHIAQALSIEAERLGFATLIADTRDSAEAQEQAIRRLVSRGVDALIILPQKGSSAPQTAVPQAIINTSSDPQNTASADHFGGGALVASHIAALGHRNILLIGANPVSGVQQDRIAGMKSTLLPEIRHEILWGEEGIAAAPELVKSGVSAILCSSDLVAINVHSHLTRAGLSVPEDVSLTGFDDMSFARVMHPPLTTVGQDVETLAKFTLDVITKQLKGEHSPHDGQTVPMELVLRQSTQAPTLSKTPSNKEQNS